MFKPTKFDLELRKKFKTHFDIISGSNKFKSYMKNNGFDKLYEWVQINETHYIDALNIMSYAYCSIGGCLMDKLTFVGIEDNMKFRDIQLQRIINTGYGVVLLNKKNEIQCVNYGFDYQYNCDFSKLNVSESVIIGEKILEYANDNNKKIQEIIKKGIQFGEVIINESVVVNPNLIGKGLFKIRSPLMSIWASMGYNYNFLRAAHFATINTHLYKKNVIGCEWSFPSLYNYYDDIKKYIKLLKEYYKYKIDYDTLKSKCLILSDVDDYGFLRKKYGFKDEEWLYIMFEYDKYVRNARNDKNVSKL